jgi:outer membrane receptor protein involved in Fe transport
MTGSLLPLFKSSFYFRLKKKNMWKIIPLFLLALLLPGALYAQNVGKVSGSVTDAETGEPLIGCTVIIQETSLGASSDLDGSYYILNVPPGKYNIQASMVGYQKVTQRNIIVNSNKTTNANFILKSSAVQIQEVVVEATRPDVEREKTSTSTIIRPEDVKQLAGMRDVGDVIGLAADVTDGHFRGGRIGEELYTLQGMGIVNPLDNSTGLLPIISAVEEVEVITSGFGAQYGNAQSGVVNISMKEGKPDKWRSHFDLNSRIPVRKYFGENVFDANSNPYLRTLLDSSSWHSPGADDPGYGYWTSMGQTLASRFGRDTAVQIAVARALWLQSRRLLNDRSANKHIDYSQEFSTGGPVSNNVRMFFALRNNLAWPVLPTEHPDVNRQIMGNLVTDLGSGTSLRISGAFGQNNTNEFPSMNSPTTPGYFRWLWDDIMSIQYRTNTNTQFGVRFTQEINKNTFYEIKLSALITRVRRGSSPFSLTIPDSMLGNIDWSKIMAQPVVAPDGFTVGSGQDDFYDSKTQTYSLDASIQSQVTKSHLLNVGIQSNMYVIKVNDHRNMTSTIPLYNIYTAKPLEASLYLQDKMEFEGMIANVGLRWDLWDQNVKYNSNIYAPYRVYDTTLHQYNYSKDAFTAKAPTLGRIQPRVGFSFPVSVNTVFHLNYGSFMQRPSFQYILNSLAQPAAGSNPLKANTLGNPTLKPQTTNSYDVGVMQGLGEGFTLDVSGYYKDVKNLIQAATFSDSLGKNSYTSYINRAYADIRGFRVMLTKRKGNITGSLNYQYSVATGKSSAVGSMMPSYSPDKPPDITNTSLKDILLDFDRTHNILITLGYTTDESWGEVSISTNSFLRSGRPYSYYNDIGIIEVANKRSPWEYNTNLQISKRIRDFFGVDALIYLEVFNLFDDRILNYDYIFQSDISGQINPNTTSYLSNVLRYQNDKRARDPQLGLDKSFLIYSNQPRSFNLGIAIDF